MMFNWEKCSRKLKKNTKNNTEKVVFPVSAVFVYLRCSYVLNGVQGVSTHSVGMLLYDISKDMLACLKDGFS